MKKLLYTMFLVINIFASFTQSLGMHRWKHRIQVHPQEETGLANMSDDIIRYIVQSIIQEQEFQSLHQLSEVNHRIRNIAVDEFLKFAGTKESPVQRIKLAIWQNFPAAITAIINDILQQNGGDDPNGIKQIASKKGVDEALIMAANNNWEISIYVILNDKDLSNKITENGATFAIKTIHSECKLALLKNDAIISLLDKLTIYVILHNAIINYDIDKVNTIVRNKLAIKKMDSDLLAQLVENPFVTIKTKKILITALINKNKELIKMYEYTDHCNIQ